MYPRPDVLGVDHGRPGMLSERLVGGAVKTRKYGCLTKSEYKKALVSTIKKYNRFLKRFRKQADLTYMIESSNCAFCRMMDKKRDTSNQSIYCSKGCPVSALCCSKIFSDFTHNIIWYMVLFHRPLEKKNRERLHEVIEELARKLLRHLERQLEKLEA